MELKIKVKFIIPLFNIPNPRNRARNKMLSPEELKEHERKLKLFYNLYFPSNKIYCDCCEKDITFRTRIQCAECEDFDLCGICYAKALEIKHHKNSHKYHVITKLDFPLFSHNWSAKEELLLFEGLEKYGFGNWADISTHIATDKSKQDCKEHYN